MTPQTYPYVGRSTYNGLEVRFTEHSTGTVITASVPPTYAVGERDDGWFEEAFKPIPDRAISKTYPTLNDFALSTSP